MNKIVQREFINIFLIRAALDSAARSRISAAPIFRNIE